MSELIFLVAALCLLIAALCSWVVNDYTNAGIWVCAALLAIICSKLSDK